MDFVEVLQSILSHATLGCTECSDVWSEICKFVRASTTPGEAENGDGK
jgi:hypothetical protein